MWIDAYIDFFVIFVWYTTSKFSATRISGSAVFNNTEMCQLYNDFLLEYNCGEVSSSWDILCLYIYIREGLKGLGCVMVRVVVCFVTCGGMHKNFPESISPLSIVYNTVLDQILVESYLNTKSIF